MNAQTASPCHSWATMMPLALWMAWIRGRWYEAHMTLLCWINTRHDLQKKQRHKHTCLCKTAWNQLDAPTPSSLWIQLLLFFLFCFLKHLTLSFLFKAHLLQPTGSHAPPLLSPGISCSSLVDRAARMQHLPWSSVTSALSEVSTFYPKHLSEVIWGD